MSGRMVFMSANVRNKAVGGPANAENVGRWPEIVVSSADKRREINQAVRAGQLRPIASRIYTSNLRDDPAALIRRHWPTVASSFFPRAVVTDRSASEPALVVDGNLFLEHEGPDRDIKLPGLALRSRRGHGPLPSDIQFGDREIYRASDARLLVENMLPSRRRGGIRRRLDQRELEEYLDRLELFSLLANHLLSAQLPHVAADPAGQPEFPFFEAYFSNLIEGTEFEVDEAKRIVDTGEVPAARPKDAHDILGTYSIVSNAGEMSRVPLDSNELIGLLRSRHATLMAARPEVQPGVFKTQNNKAGGTTFVDWRLVMGTLREGFEIGHVLTDPLSRAIYVMFAIAEIHPFDDGNGRLARIFMNAELFRAREQRIFVPTSRRDDYLNALRLHSRQRRPDLLSRVMAELQQYAAQIDWTSFESALQRLREDGALAEPARGGFGALLADSGQQP